MECGKNIRELIEVREVKKKAESFLKNSKNC